MKKAIVLGAGGFIGNHLVNKLVDEGYWVRGVDIKRPLFSESKAHDFHLGDLRDKGFVDQVLDIPVDETYQLAADMGGAAYLFTGENDAAVVHNSAIINLHVAQRSTEIQSGKLLFSSSACIYPQYNQEDPDNPICTEHSAYPAQPDSEYGWEKLFSERLYMSYHRNFKLDIRIARFHNVYGPESVFEGGREKAPAALCRKVAKAESKDQIEVWGDGLQTRSFLYIDDCLKGMEALMKVDFHDPLNIGSEEMISINDFALLIAKVAGKEIQIKNIPGPEGVRGRCSDNRLVNQITGWQPSTTLKDGILKNYVWVDQQIKATVNH